VRVLQVSLAQVIPVPPQVPLVQTSVWVHAFASLHTGPVRGVTAQVEVPLHVWVLQVSLVQVIAVPPQVPLVQTSVWVHAFASLQDVPLVTGNDRRKARPSSCPFTRSERSARRRQTQGISRQIARQAHDASPTDHGTPNLECELTAVDHEATGTEPTLKGGSARLDSLVRHSAIRVVTRHKAETCGAPRCARA
jgi:uncharacterized membrane protein